MFAAMNARSVELQGGHVVEADLGGDGFGRLLEDTRRALGALRTGNGGVRPEGEPAEPVHGEGSAADGRITARVVSGGHLEALKVDPRLMRAGSEAICAQIIVAVNAAMDDLRGQTSQAAPAAMDPEALAGMLENLQTESARELSRFTQGVAETVAKISAAAEGARRGR
jgi:DNA-binding protein YbaB